MVNFIKREVSNEENYNYHQVCRACYGNGFSPYFNRLPAGSRPDPRTQMGGMAAQRHPALERMYRQ
jgi:hypothetical protein